VVKKSTKWDAFISHASEDKSAIARPIAKGLQSRGVKVWYDEFSLNVGDSLRATIDHGLLNSKFGVVILSKNFFAKHWPEQELNALATREKRGKKVILPVWYEVEFAEVRKYSPILADRIAARFSDGLEGVIEKLVKVIAPSTELHLTQYAAEYVQNLEALLTARTAQLFKLQQDLERAHDLTIESFGDMLDLAGESRGHTKRVTAFTIAIARVMGISRQQIAVIARGVFLHDIGILSLRRLNGSQLTREEEMTKHPEIGYSQLKKMPFLEDAAEVVYAQEERYDGSGFPRGLKGTDIPLGARVFAVAHEFDLFTATRAESDDSAVAKIVERSGTWFDPDIVEKFVELPIGLFGDLRRDIEAMR
jgi:response regulator RpfG family c-di-GMP phosphodiesterase